MKHVAYMGMGSLRVGVAALALLLIAGCGGWHLREKPMYESLEPIFLEHLNSSAYGDTRSKVYDNLIRELRRSGAVLASSQREARTHLTLSEGSKQFLSSVDGDGKANEYRIRYTVTYELLNEEKKSLLGAITETRSSNYSFDRLSVTGSAVSREIIEEKLANEIALRILRRLQRL